MSGILEKIEVVNMTKNDHCSNCGECCTDFIPMSSNEVNRIKSYLEDHPGVKEQRHSFAKYDITCPFRDSSNKKCLIYEVRPKVCRRFLCNKDYESLLKDKIDLHSRYNIVQMRTVFFGSDEYERMFKEIIFINF